MGHNEVPVTTNQMYQGRRRGERMLSRQQAENH